MGRGVSLALLVRTYGAGRYGDEDVQAMDRALSETLAWAEKARADVGRLEPRELIQALRLRFEANRGRPCTSTSARGNTRSSAKRGITGAACKGATTT